MNLLVHNALYEYIKMVYMHLYSEYERGIFPVVSDLQKPELVKYHSLTEAIISVDPVLQPLRYHRVYSEEPSGKGFLLPSGYLA